MIPDPPENSGLLLSDGLLSIADLEEALAKHAPSIVFLSSCLSGATDYVLEDAPNLSSVFLQKGTQIVIGALWPVPDFIAAFTARKFYKHLRYVDPVTALKRTQTELMDKITGYDWAAFRLQGWAQPDKPVIC